MKAPLFFVALTLLALIALLVAERFDARLGRTIAKPLAATGYVAVALSMGALDSGYGMLILLGLVLSWAGDLFLLPQDAPRIFRAGILSFLLAHIAYAAAFVLLGLDFVASGITAIVAAVAAAALLRWLMPHVGDDLRRSVIAYVAVISCMLVAAAGAAYSITRTDVFLGAFLFYLSDLSVARDRFVAAGFVNAAWGLPFYFIGQLLLALSV